MKNIYILFLLIFLVGACYEDKGNYDYEPIKTIEMSGLEAEYPNMVSMKSRLQISPQFPGREDYNFTWTLFSSTIVQAPIDTISADMDLDYLITETPDRYTLMLEVENKKNGDKQFFTSYISVTTEYSTGWYILKEVDGETDIDLITPDGSLLANLLENTSNRLAGKPMAFSLCPSIAYIGDEGEKYTKVRTLWMCSDSDVSMLRLDNLRPVYDIHTMFFEERTGEQPRSFTCDITSLGYLSNNGYYYMALNVISAAPKFGLPLVVSNATSEEATNCRPVKYVFRGVYFNMLYDELNCRFLLVKNGVMYRFLDTGKDGVAAISPNRMNSDLLYMFTTTANGYALMADKTTGERVVYQLEKDEYDSWNMKLYSPIKNVKRLSDNMQIYKAETFGNHGELPYIYYATEGNRLHMYDYAVGKEELDIVAPFDGKITFIKHIYWKNSIEENFEYLVVATEQGGRYKIHFYRIVGGKPVEEVKTQAGEGSVALVHYISPNMLVIDYKEYPY